MEHYAPAGILLLRQQHQHQGDQKFNQYSGHGENQERTAEIAQEVGVIDVDKDQQGQENLENELVDLPGGGLVQQAGKLDHIAQSHHQKQGQYGIERDKQAFHVQSPNRAKCGAGIIIPHFPVSCKGNV